MSRRREGPGTKEKKEKRGKHLSQHTVIKREKRGGIGLGLEPADEKSRYALQMMASFERHNKNFPDLAQRIEDWCDPILENVGISTEGRHGFVAEAERLGIDYHSVDFCIARVRDALDEARALHPATSRSNPKTREPGKFGDLFLDAFASAMLELGCLMTQARMLADFGYTMDGVDRRREGASRARRAEHAQRRPRVRERDRRIREAAAEVRARHPDWSESSVVAEVRKRVRDCPGDRQTRRIIRDAQKP